MRHVTRSSETSKVFQRAVHGEYYSGATLFQAMYTFKLNVAAVQTSFQGRVTSRPGLIHEHPHDLQHHLNLQMHTSNRRLSQTDVIDSH